MRAPAIVFCDMDDTFLSPEKELVARNMAALDALAARGIPFVPCTGRGLNGIEVHGALAGHPAVRYAVTSSGAVVYDMAVREVLHARAVGADRARALYGLVSELDVTFDVFADGRTFAERFRYERLKGFGIDGPMLAHMLRSRTPVDLSMEQILAQAKLIERLGIFNRMDAAGRATQARVKSAVESVEGLRWAQSHPAGIEVVDAGCSKGEALAWLCGYLGIDTADAAAFGDSGNDLEMIAAAGMGVAMGNGEPAVRSAAQMIAPTNGEAGVAVVLEQMLGL